MGVPRALISLPSVLRHLKHRRRKAAITPSFPVLVINALCNAGSLAHSFVFVVSQAINSRICSPEPQEIQMMGLFVFS